MEGQWWGSKVVRSEHHNQTKGVWEQGWSISLILLVVSVSSVGTDSSGFEVFVHSPVHAITGQTVQLYCNFSLPRESPAFYSLKWFLGDEEVYRLVPGAARHLQRLVFHTEAVTIDLENSKLIDTGVHQLILQRVSMTQSGEYRCQVTLDSPPFRFLSASAPLVVMVLPERLPVISGLSTRSGHPTHMGYLPGDKLSINCTAAPSHPGASLTWLVNRRKVDRWMVTNYLPVTYPSGLTSSVLGLSFLVLAEHFRGPERELWATCRATMPPIKGVVMPVERSLLLGGLNHLDNHLGNSHRLKGAASGHLDNVPKLLIIILLLMKLHSL